MEPDLRNAVFKCASLFDDGLIAYTTLTQMTSDIAKSFVMEHRAVQELVDNMIESWEES